ncbi:MAG: cytochrome b N-terminal domain-containing protein [Planctomycetota bacterium]|nr:cytochrome b N-terminal domain-containing protein [Planctomycetota bacterium]MDA0919473.1 cytochrome b N-terminal domain-containing protein [Planctomycetota bacterium]MDA1160925.1 cytochrome b N-terminal domain-containing protein [Planctomycetota bacterium]
MIRSLLAWLDNRTGCNDLIHEALYEKVPGGARWRYVWGSTLVFTFVLQMITGIFLWTAYSPSAQTAWESVYYIQEVMFLGKIVRGMHHFAAQAMVVLLAIHLIQVIIDGAYKAPREINFWLGLILMKIILGLSLTGYLLPWDQKGYYATQVSTKIMGATPVIGAQLQEVVQGGAQYNHHTLTRFFAMHAGILPGLLIGFLALHLYVFRRHGLTVHQPKKKPDTTFWPDQVLKDGVACLGVLAVVLLFAIFKGAELSPPADAAKAYAAARPEWYFLFLFRFLKFEAVEHLGLAFGAIYVPGALMGILFMMPLTAKMKVGHRFNVAFTWLVTFGIVVLTTLAFYEDANNEDHQAAIAEAERDAHRIKELASRPTMIPVEGAVSLLREDPFTQGPVLFAKYCASCHRYNGHNGRGIVLREKDENKNTIISIPEATDLANFGSRDWMKAIITDYGNHFAPLKNAQWYPGADDTEFNLDDSEMASASEEYAEAFTSPENANDLNALVEALVAMRGWKGDKESIDAKLVERGQQILDGEPLADGTEISSCTDCHDTIGSDFEFTGEGAGYPDLAEYGSAKWLKAFISDPGSDQFYGAKNHMPAYADKMNAKDLDLLVRWMTGDYHETHVEDYPSRVSEVFGVANEAATTSAE